jgi:phenylacetate-coenzyme A ligase PaaK-like adenylate-forming protein
MLSDIKKIYDSLPKEHLKFLRYIPDRVLFGKSYIEWKSKVSFDKNLFDKNLFDTLNYTREHTLFGRDHIPLKFDLFEAKNVLESLPIISSYDVSTNLDYYTSDEFNRFNSYKTTTGGTGRNPTTVLLSNEAYGIEWAHGIHYWSYAGYQRQRDIRLTLRGKSIKGNKLVEYNPIYNELVVDVYKVKDDNFEEFIHAIKKYPIRYIFGYPSLVKEFMTYFEKYNYIPALKGILLSSEAISVEDKQLIHHFFKTNVVSHYGQTEKVTFAADIEANGMHKIYSTYGYPRIVNGEIVATSFVNRALPLINYHTGDGGEIIEDEHALYLRNISSRRGKDFIYLNKEKRFSIILLQDSKVQNEILYIQIHQKEFGKIEIRVLPKINSVVSHNELLKILKSEIETNFKAFEINIKIVDENEIIKSNRGKMILLVQELTR